MTAKLSADDLAVWREKYPRSRYAALLGHIDAITAERDAAVAKLNAVRAAIEAVDRAIALRLLGDS